MMDQDIPRQVHDSFQHSVDLGQVHLYHTTATHPVAADPPHFPQTGHIVPQLGDKPQVPPTTPDLSTRRERDPLQGPYPPGEHVLDLVSPATGATYSIVHNLHALAPEHAMLVPHFDDKKANPFRPQTSTLTQDDLWAAYRVVRAYADAGRETTMFFNGGPLAGASQPHLHMQFIPFQHSRPPGPEALARSIAPRPTSFSASPPVPARLPLPWVNLYLPLPRSSSVDVDVDVDADADALTPESLHATYLALLAARDDLVQARLASSTRAPNGSGATTTFPREAPSRDINKRNSHNVFLTRSHMHLVPRTERLVRVPRRPRGECGGPSPRPSPEPRHGHGQANESALPRPTTPTNETRPNGHGGEDKGEGKGDRSSSFGISLNGLVYLGYWYAADESDWDDMCALGLAETLTSAAYANDEYEPEQR